MMSDKKKLTDDQLDKVSGGTGELFETESKEETDYNGVDATTYEKNHEWIITGNDN